MTTVPVLPLAVQAQLEQILESATFHGAERSRTLLQFIVGETLRGRADRLKDYTLGSEALGRGERFDPRTDPIARVEASRLRSRLDVYYATEGMADPVRILLPKGGYTPVFEPRPAQRLPETTSVEQASPTVAPRGQWTVAVRWGAVALAAALLGTLAGWQLGRNNDASGGPQTRLEIVTPATTDAVSLALSPDGRTLVFVASAEGTSHLWIRRLETGNAQPLTGTEYGSLPFWAPDGRSVGFFADGSVKRIELSTGLVRPISTALVPAGATWNRDGVILHPVVPDGPIFRTTLDGSPLVAATRLIPGQTGHRGPAFLPDGRRFLFHAAGDRRVSGLYAGELGTTVVRRLLEADAPAVIAPPDRVVYVQHSTLFVQRIDPETLVPIGGPVALAEGVPVEALSGAAAVSVSASTLAYRSAPSASQRQFVWRDRHGIEVSRIGAPQAVGPSYASLSPDGRRLAVQRTADGNTDIAILDAESGRSIRFTTEPQPDIAPHWSPNGDRIAYAASRDGAFQLFTRMFDGRPQLLLDTPLSKQITDWSRDGRYLLFRTTSFPLGLDMDIWSLALDGHAEPFPEVHTPFVERDAQFSPDGRFIAYQSNESGQFEIYVKRFRAGGLPLPISKSGGVQARWGVAGRELFFVSLQGQLMSVPMTLAADGSSMTAGSAVALFQTHAGSPQGVPLPSYLVSHDGQRFLTETVIEQTPSPIAVVLNWSAPRDR